MRQSKGNFLSISEFIPIAVRFNENIILLLLSQFLIIEREIKRERDPDRERVQPQSLKSKGTTSIILKGATLFKTQGHKIIEI